MARRIICVFPGQGSQFVGMGKDLWEVDAAVRALYKEANDVLGYDLRRLCFEGPEAELMLTQHTQPAILVHSVALWLRVQQQHDVHPAFLAGHSLGEYSALVAAGVLTFADAIRLVHQRGRFMQEAVPPGDGSMAALLGVPRQQVDELCAEFVGDGVLQAANYNEPGQIVIAGETARVHAVVEAVKTRRLGRPRLLKVSAPFHCRMLQPAAERLGVLLRQVTYQPFQVSVLSNVTAQPYRAHQDVPQQLVAQVCAPVRWEDSMRYAVEQGCDSLLEVGPGKVLAGLMHRIAPAVEVLALDEVIRLPASAQ